MPSRGVRDRSPPGLLASKAAQAYWQSVEETEREKPRRARGSNNVAGIHEESGQVVVTPRLRINRHLEALVGERHPETSPRALRRAAHYLATQFAKSGWATGGQLVSAWGKVYRNVVAIKNPDWPRQGEELPPLLIGAHYDTVSGSPGADDNASGLVVLLEVASRLRARPLARPIWLVAFCLEEQDRLGSQAFASRLKAERRELAGAIILECVGFTRSETGSQQTPPDIPIAVPTQGDFLAIVGDEASRSLVLQLEQEAQRHAARLKPLSLVVPGRGEAMPHTRRSDHASFWDAGYPAVMLTDTANFRNPHYHRETDTVDTLNLEFLSNVTATVTATAIQIAGARP